MSVGCRQRTFSVLSLAFALEIRPTLLDSDIKSPTAFYSQKYATLNDLKWLFYVNFCFRACRCRTFSAWLSKTIAQK